MLYEVAFTPDVFDAKVAKHDDTYRRELLELLREIELNGLISNLDDGRLLDQCGGRAKSWGSLGDDIRAYLMHLEHLNRVVPHPASKRGTPKTDIEWLDLARESLQHCDPAWIVVGNSVRRQSTGFLGGTTSLDNLRALSDWKYRRFSATVPMNDDGYRSVLRNVVRYAGQVDLVDPHFSVSKFEVVKTVASLMSEVAHILPPRRIYLHLWRKPEDVARDDQNPTLNEWESLIEQFKIKSRVDYEIRVHMWTAKTRNGNGKAPEMHDRFLLTDQCGFLLGNGFDRDGERDKRFTTWSLLDRDTWRARQNDLVLASERYELVGKRSA